MKLGLKQGNQNRISQKNIYLPDKTVVSTVKYLCRCSSALSCGNSLESSQNPHLNIEIFYQIHFPDISNKYIRFSFH